MSKAPPAAAPAEGEAPKKKSKLLLIIIIAVVVLVAAGAGAFFILNKGHGGEEGGAEPPKAEKKHKAEPGKPPTYVNLETFTVKLAAESGEPPYLQVAIALKVDDAHAGDAIKNFMPEIRHRILMLLSSKKGSELSTEVGLTELADQIKEEINGVIGTPGGVDKRGKKREAEGPVASVLFTSFIVQ
ncbi:MAG: flagellar basal body-associated FliL family protein [Rhodocyclaceae bacterium]|nr:flagellar basal body-associated FliL family protein [Rhodocyclaceae bacterium]